MKNNLISLQKIYSTLELEYFPNAFSFSGLHQTVLLKLPTVAYLGHHSQHPLHRRSPHKASES